MRKCWKSSQRVGNQVKGVEWHTSKVSKNEIKRSQVNSGAAIQKVIKI